MLSTNVLCIKKRKKRSYCIANNNKSGYGATSVDRNKRASSGGVTMLQITEDTPPDMLAGAMDLTVHLPSGRPVKMAVERSTPMMDLLVQITTHHQLQLSGYTLQALDMAPSNDRTDRFLPFKPNTPIGALDTQHVKVIPKSRAIPASKNIAPGKQPFESTFRLKVHLPRNQLFVTRVSQSVHLEDIMKKVCEEKNLDPHKYEFRHPGNLDEVLDPKLTLSDYQITEIYVVLKGTASLNQTFSTSDIMALRKEEERKQMHNKTGGGVFNLIFRRGKSSTGSGSLSSENRSISPTQSDDSRSVTPPAVQQTIITPPQPDPPVEKPKPPQRKRRPAPKPPQVQAESKPSSNISDSSKKSDTGLIISHSRNSSDSSGYHEASILSDNCNTSLPRRPKSTMIIPEDGQGSNLKKMAVQSKSTSSLGFISRKKKSAPPPPPPIAVLKPAESVTSFESPPSPVVASQPVLDGNGHDLTVDTPIPVPVPRTRTKIAPIPRTRSNTSSEESPNYKNLVETINPVQNSLKLEPETDEGDPSNSNVEAVNPIIDEQTYESEELDAKAPEPKKKHMHVEDVFKIVIHESEELPLNNCKSEELPESKKNSLEEDIKQKQMKLLELQKQHVRDVFKTEAFVTTPPEEVSAKKPPEIIALHPKSTKKEYSKSMFDSYTRKRGFQIGSSLIDDNSEPNSPIKKVSSDLSTTTSVASALNAFDFGDEIDGVDVEMFTGSLSKNSKSKNKILNELHGIHDLCNKKNFSRGSLRSVSSVPGFIGGNMKKWGNMEDLDLETSSNKWVIGDNSDAESTVSMNATVDASLSSTQSLPNPVLETKIEESPTIFEENPQKEPENVEMENDWQYQLPSPPKAFRDSSPVAFTTNTESVVDSVVTSPELFEKLNLISKDSQSEEKETVVSSNEVTSVISEDDKPILNKLSLENLEKRKSLVYNRELATSFKLSEEAEDAKTETFSNSLTKFEKTYEEMNRSSPKETVPLRSTLPNFKITTYDNPKQKLNIFEDDTIRSNSNEGSKRNSVVESRRVSEEAPSNLQKTYIGRSMENISFLRKNSLGEEFKKPNDYKFYKPKVVKNHINVNRSESFSSDQWTPMKPVTRSKSQVALNKNRPSSQFEDENLSKSNSLFDVSGLQSLGVMRLIQNKLNTPTNSVENLQEVAPPAPVQQIIPIKPEKEKEKEKEKPPVKSYQYHTPSINMSTWSERPKIPVNVKDDPDYKYSNTKLIVNTVNNDVKSNNSVEIRNKSFMNNKNVSIKVNGSEPISAQNTGNVVIKIGENNFRKPLGNINKIGNTNSRPHSIAFGNEFDISRVPIVRSVEFKKPYKDFQNTSVTHIYSNNNNLNSFHKSSENLSNKPPQNEPTTKSSVFRVSNYIQNTSVPTVRGFRTNADSNKIQNRFSWSQPQNFSTLPAKTTTNIVNRNSDTSKKEFSTNQSVPFSQSNLRRTESAKVPEKIPPPAPVMPKLNPAINHSFEIKCQVDPKEQLLQAIRDFGGKKGLRAVKA